MDIRPQQATADDVPPIHGLRRSLEQWMAARGVDQWPVGSMPVEQVAAQVADGQWWVVRDDAGVRGCLRLLDADPEYWGDDDAPALYVHGLMVDRRASGTGLGRALVEWAGERARDAGVTWLRLDHRESNPHLDDVYRSWGFEPVGVTDRPGFAVVLMQRPVHVGVGAPELDRVVLTCGPAGAGKSTYARRLEAQGYVRLSFDETAWRLGHRRHPVDAAVADEVHALLQRRLLEVLAEGGRVVVDTSFWSRASRDRYRAFLAPHGVVPVVHHLDTPVATILRRLADRRDAHGDDVRVPLDVALAHVAGFEVPTPDEGPLRVVRT